jgi:hypothetical protein
MEEFPNTSISSHAFYLLEVDKNEKYETKLSDHNIINEDFKYDNKKLSFFHTCTLVFRRNLLRKMPSFYYEAPTGDEPLRLFMSYFGRVIYLRDNMSIYRKNVAESWTEKQQDNKNAIKKYLSQMVFIEKFNKFSHQEYQNNFIKQMKNSHLLNLLFILRKNGNITKFMHFIYTAKKFINGNTFIKAIVLFIFGSNNYQRLTKLKLKKGEWIRQK